MKKTIIVGLFFCWLFASGFAATVPVKDVFVSAIQLSTEKSLSIGGIQTVTVKVENSSGNAAIGNLEIAIVGPNAANSVACSSGNQPLAIGTSTFNYTFSPTGSCGTAIATPFDKVGAYKAVAIVSSINPAASDPLKANNSSEAFFFVAANPEKTIPEIGALLLPLITLVILYITRGCLR